MTCGGLIMIPGRGMGKMRLLLTGFCFIVWFVSASGASIQNDRPMTNQDVVKLLRLGLSMEIVLAKINESAANYDLSVDGLTMLGQNHVPNEVIKAMQAKSTGQLKVAPGSVGSNHPAGGDRNGTGGAPTHTPSVRGSGFPLPSDKGAYLWDGVKLHLLYQSTVPSIGQNFWRSITPFVKRKFELQLIGPFAAIHFDNSQPTILVSGLGEVIP